MKYFLVFLCMSFSAYGSEDLSKITPLLLKHPQVKGSFIQIRKIKDLKLELKSEGTFHFKLPLDLNWHQKKPFVMDLQMSPEKVVQINPGSAPVTISKEQQPMLFAFSSSFLGVFSGDQKSIEKNFEYEASIEGTRWTLNLKPKDELFKKAILKVKVEGAEFVERVLVEETSGGSTLIRFLNVKGA